MRIPIYTIVSFLFIFVTNAISQISQEKPLTVTIKLTNELTGKPVDATLEWPDNSAVKRVAPGVYTVALERGTVETLSISRDGYFNKELKLDYNEEKENPNHDIKLQPGTPQLRVTVMDDETGEKLPCAIDLFTMDESTMVFSEAVETFPYTIDLEYNEVHVLQVRQAGYFSYKDTIDFKNVFEGKTRDRKIKLVSLKVGNKISLNNIYFKAGEANLTDFAKIMLVELTHVLGKQKDVVIEIAAHTDSEGSNEFNQSLSEKRAVAVKKYLTEKGAEEKQLLTRGYGESLPIGPNDSEGNKALNRRVEFKIVSIN